MNKRKFNKWFNGAATLLTILGMLGPFSFHGVNIASATTGNITGFLTKSDEVTVVTDGTVCAYPIANFTSYENSCASLVALGAFTLPVTQVGATYQINFWGNATDDVNPASITQVFSGVDVSVGVIHMVAPSVKGKVLNPDGSAAANTSIMIHTSDYNSSATKQSSISTNSEGIFLGGALDSGSYYIDVMPMPGFGSTALTTRGLAVTVIAGSTNSYYFTTPIQLAAAKKTITGTVTKADGTPVTNASLNAFSINASTGFGQANTDSNGQYSILMGAGKFQVMVMSQGGGTPTWGYFDAPKTVNFIQDNSIAESQTVNFQVTNFTSTITGKVLMPNGQPATTFDANVMAMISGGYGSNSSTQPDSLGIFSLKVAPNYTYQVNVMPFNQQNGSPEDTIVSIGDGETVDIGTISLVSKTSVISGKVADASGTGLANINVNTWKMNGTGWGNAQTDSNGDYSLYVTPGTWFVDAMGSSGIGGNSSYVKTQAPQRLVVAANETKSNTNITLTIADATISGTVQDAAGTVLSSINTFAYANDVNRSIDTSGMMMGFSDLGGMVQNGSFSIKVPAGTYQLGVMMPPGSSYTPSTTENVTMTAGQSKTDAIITLLPNDATIAGSLLDQSGNVLSTVSGEVFADNGAGGHQWSPFESGTYTLSVAAGDWRIGYWVNPASGYISGRLSSNKITAAANVTTTNNITLLKADSTITVTVKDPNGQAIKNAWVAADTELAGRQSSTEQMGMMGGMFNQGNITNANGQVTLHVPAGTYFVSATLPPDQGYIFPAAQEVITSVSSPATATLQFRQANGTITGAVTLNGTANAAYVNAWSEDGAFSETNTSDGSYTLNIIKNQNWHVSASYETSTKFYRSSEHNVSVDSSGTASQNLALVLSDITLSPPETATFDSTKGKTMTLLDGTKIDMPAYSVATNGNVTVTATPKVQGIPTTASAKPIALAYDLVAKDSQNKTISSFQSNVTITLPYTNAQLAALGITEDDISPMYYDTTSGGWKTVNNVVVDKDNNTISFTVSHFTSFAITTGSVAGTAVSSLSITLTSPENNARVSTSSVILSGTVSDAAASVTYSLNSGTAQAVTVDSTGTFSQTVSGLAAGSNSLTVSAIKSLDSISVSRTVTYSDAGDDIAGSIELGLVTIPKNGGPQVRVFDRNGNLLFSFFAYDKNLRGEIKVVTADVNGDSNREIIVYPAKGLAPHVRIFDHRGTFLTQFYAFQQNFRGGVEITTADVTGDGRADLIVKPQQDGGPQVRIYSYNTTARSFALIDSFMAYAASSRYKFNLTAADIDNNGTAEIAVVPATAAGAQVKVYRYNSTTTKIDLIDSFLAYPNSFRGGANIALANVSGGTDKELIVAPADKGGPNVRIYEYNSATHKFSLKGSFFAFQESYRGGVNLLTGDLNNDGLSDIITTATNGSSNVRIFRYNSTTAKFALLGGFTAYAAGFRGGVTVALSNIDGDSYNEVAVIPTSKGGPDVRIYEYNSTTSKLGLLDSVMAYTSSFRGQVQLKVADLDGNGDSEIITVPTTIGGPQIKIFDYRNSDLSLLKSFMAYPAGFRGGVKLTTGI